MVSKVAEQYKEYFDLGALIKDIKAYIPKFDEKKFIEAFEFAEKYHKGQERKSGEPYIVHPVETAKTLVKLRFDEDTLIAALLHDVPEDTEATIEQIDSYFGENVAFLVSGITKLSKVYYQNNMAERQIESLKKLLIHTAKDPRVIIIKLADRLHNMRTLEFIPKPDKRERISRETLEIYVPIANLLGIQDLKSQLEDLCFKNLYPEPYKKLREKIEDTLVRQKGVLEKMMTIIKESLAERGIKAKVYGREKSLFSIYKKITSENKSIDDIHDRLALRIITESKNDCYAALGVVHDIFNAKPGHFKDYIGVPKVNGYQSIHTTVFGVSGVLTEIQIRTMKMHLDAEYGIAAHYFYDESKNDNKFLVEDQRANWAGKILDLQKMQSGSEDFISDLKIDIFQDRIFVFTPKGETIDLPKNATAIDFAYAIHSEVGDHAYQAEINNEIKPIITPLKTGDLINILTSTGSRPELYWLSFAKTHVARNKIRLFLKKESLKRRISNGINMLQKELDRNGLGLIEDLSLRKINSILKDKYNKVFENKKTLLAAIGEGDVSVVDIVKSLTENKKQSLRIFIRIVADDRKGLLKDITSTLIKFNLNMISSHAYISAITKKAITIIGVEFESIEQFSELCQNLEQIDGVIFVNRLFRQTKLSFNLVALTTIAIWVTHPIIISAILNLNILKDYSFISTGLLYLGMFMLLFTVVYLRKIIHKSFPSFRNVRWIWGVTFFAATIAVFALLFELYFFNLHINWLIIFGGIIAMYAYLAYQYYDIEYTKEVKS